MAIIQSLLDTDLYKLTMMQAVLHQFPGTQVEYEFKCRNKGTNWTPDMTFELYQEVDSLCSLKFQEAELEYLSSLRFLKPDFIEFLRIFQLDSRYLDISIFGGDLKITIKGPWLHTILFEVPLLAIINEIYFKFHGVDSMDVGMQKLKDKICLLETDVAPTFKITDFGTRRRYSAEWQAEVVRQLATFRPNNFIGTSNVMLAKQYGIKPIGTMAHEWLQAGQALTKVKESQKFMFQKWADEYRGDLGIALSDVVGVDAFIRDFDMYFCKLFDGCRHDSGDPIEWVEKIIAMYERHGIDPKTKIAVFSDGLTLDKAIAISGRVNGRIKTTFGIGTNLTNDVGVDPLNIVIKMTKCNGQPVAKISDSPGKCMCEDPEYLKYLRDQTEVI
jgi:nicotinate phosphoribosyltransferase